MEMGLFDDVLNVKKEAGYNRPVRVTSSQKNLERNQPSTPRTPLALSNVSIFGSLKKATTDSTIPKKPLPANVYDVKKKIGTTKGKLPEKPKEKRNWFRVSPRKDPDIKACSTSLNVVGGNNHKSVVFDGAKKKTKSIFLDSNVTYRRGQNTKLDGQNIDNLSRTSSITNLDADTKASKGAKPKKSASRDRLDKIGEHKKNDKKSPPKNNNKLETDDIPYPSIELTQEEEFLELKKQLQEMAQEKTNLALQLGEQKGQLQTLQKEIVKLKAYQEESNKELEHLTEENTALRNRLRDVAHSPLSDNEKQQLLFESHRQHSSAPASIATNLLDEGTGGDNTTCTTPDWDKHSSSNVSEVSVACLQDKINQMQETHYSTNEELQATLQELTDLQRQLTELQQENERLTDEKSLMFDSLCRQTERLNDSRSEVESLKQLLYQEKDDASQFESAVEREQKLVALLKSAQEERENLLMKLDQLNNELQEARTAVLEKDDRIAQLSERVKTLECTLDAKHAEHKLLDQDLAQARDQCSGKQIEINRLSDLLENARTQINELEQDRALSDKSELDELLDNARKEKDTLESEVAHLKKQLALSKNEIEKFKEQVSILQEECKVTRNNARTTQSDLEYKCEKLMKEKIDLNGQIQEFQEALNELQVQSQCQLEEKRQLSAVLSETQRNLSEAERKNLSLENEVEELKKLRAEENAEWEKFQSDLLTSVRVANDFKTEAQQQLQRMILENKSFRDRERQLQAELEKLKEPISPTRQSATINLSNSEPSNMDQLLKRPKQRGITKRQSGTYESGEKSQRKRSMLEEKTDTRQQKKVEFSTVIKDNTHKDKTLPTIPNKNNSQLIKRSNRTLLAQKRFKSVSVEEEHLLDSLKRRYEEIEKLPQNKRSEMDHSIVRLKQIYDDDNLKYKPIALKPKDQLAISKPLLESVFHNPKLRSIALNPGIKSLEDTENYLSRTSLLDKQDPVEEPRKLTKPVSIDGISQLHDTKKKSLMTRSYSYGDSLNYSEALPTEIPLYRSVIAEDLTRTPSLLLRRSSTILPSDSASNFRSSDTSIDMDVKLRRETMHACNHAEATNFNNISFSTFKYPSSTYEIYEDSNVDTGSIEVQKTETDSEGEQITSKSPTSSFKETKHSLARYRSINAKFEQLHKLIHEDEKVPLRRLKSLTLSTDDDAKEDVKLSANRPMSINNPMTTSLNTSCLDSSRAKSINVIESNGGVSKDTNNQVETEEPSNIHSSKDMSIENPYFCAIEQENGERKSPKAKTDFETGEDVKGIVPSQIRHPKAEQEYHYTNILKENKYGVTTPLSVRISYRDCMNEMKYRVEKVAEDLDEADSNKNNDLDNDDDLYVEKCDSDNETNILKDTIDSEMEEIFKKYLKMPISKVLSQNELNKEPDEVKNQPSKVNTVTEEIHDLAAYFKVPPSPEEGCNLTEDTLETCKSPHSLDEEEIDQSNEETGDLSLHELEFNDNGRQIVGDEVVDKTNRWSKAAEGAAVSPENVNTYYSTQSTDDVHLDHNTEEAQKINWSVTVSSAPAVRTPLELKEPVRELITDLDLEENQAKPSVFEKFPVYKLDNIKDDKQQSSTVSEGKVIANNNTDDYSVYKSVEESMWTDEQHLNTELLSITTNDNISVLSHYEEIIIANETRGTQKTEEKQIELEPLNKSIANKFKGDTRPNIGSRDIRRDTRSSTISANFEAAIFPAHLLPSDSKLRKNINQSFHLTLQDQSIAENQTITAPVECENEDRNATENKDAVSEFVERRDSLKYNADVKEILEPEFLVSVNNQELLDEFTSKPLQNPGGKRSPIIGPAQNTFQKYHEAVSDEDLLIQQLMLPSSHRKGRGKPSKRNTDVGIVCQASKFETESKVELTDSTCGNFDTTKPSKESSKSDRLELSNSSVECVDSQQVADKSASKVLELSQPSVIIPKPALRTAQKKTVKSQSKYNDEIFEEDLLMHPLQNSLIRSKERSKLSDEYVDGTDPHANTLEMEYDVELIDSTVGNLNTTVSLKDPTKHVSYGKLEISNSSVETLRSEILDVIDSQKLTDESSVRSIEPLQTTVSKPQTTMNIGPRTSHKHQTECLEEVSDEDLFFQQLLLSPSNRKERNKQRDTEISMQANKFEKTPVVNTTVMSNTNIEGEFTENTNPSIQNNLNLAQSDESKHIEIIRRRNILPVPLKPADDSTKSTSTRKSQDTLIEETSSKRISFPTFDRKLLSNTRKVKSFAQHFEKLSADQKKLPTLNRETKTISFLNRRDPPVEKIERKPQPLPRKVNQAIRNITTSDTANTVKIDRNMTDFYENFSDKNVSPYLNMSDNINLKQDDLEDAPKIISEEYKEGIIKEVGKPKSNTNRDVVIRNTDLKAGGSSARAEQSSMRASFSPSSIAVAGKFESLNLTDSSIINSLEEVDDTDSYLNLFNMDSANLEDSYLNLFKSPEDVVYENLTRKQNLRGFLNVVCLEERSDTESDDDSVGRYEKIETILECGSKPKIIDFLPLDDDDTKNVFDKSVSIESTKHFSSQACSSMSVEDTTAVSDIVAPRITVEPKIEKEKEDLMNSNTNSQSYKSAKNFFERLEFNNNNNNDSIDVEAIKNLAPEQ